MNTAVPLITLDPRSHVYSCNGNRLESVSSLVKRVTPQFDADYHAARIAAKQGKTKDQVLAEWAEKRDTGLDTGRKLHWFVERVVGGSDGQAELSQILEAKAFDALDKCKSWLDWWRNTGSKSLEVLACEKIVGDPELGFAGTPDLLANSKKTSQAHLLDWKQNKAFRTENQYGERLLPPFGDLWNCELATYSLQVELYALALERGGQPCGDGWVLHLSPERATPHKALRLRERALEWVKGLNL